MALNTKTSWELLKYIWKLEEENKKLKENNDKLKELVKIPCTSYTRDLEKENKKLNEKIRFLEQCLDNKEKVNISLREELEKLKVKYWDLDY